MGAAYLLRHGLEAQEATTQAGILLSEVVGLPPMRLSLQRDTRPTEAQIERLRQLFRRVGAGEPIQYVIGHWPFHNIELKTDARALIPRPETEELVERILHSEAWAQAEHIVDVGVGTGAIVLALAQAARGSTRRFTGIDLSAEALSLAQENAQALGLTVNFIHGSSCAMLPQASVDILVSNPPYIASAEVDVLSERIRCHEPRMALDGGASGLDTLRQILLDATMVLKPNGSLFFEMGDDQALAMQRLLERAGYSEVEVWQDLAGHDRMISATLR